MKHTHEFFGLCPMWYFVSASFSIWISTWSKYEYLNIKTFKSCKFHPYHSKLESLSFESVYEFITKEPLSNAHSSIVDAKAQTKIVCHEYYRSIFSRKNSIKFISNIFYQKFKHSIQKSLESTRPVHGKWKADIQADSWDIPNNYKYVDGMEFWFIMVQKVEVRFQF